MVLVVAVAFLAGLEGNPWPIPIPPTLVACTLIGLVTGNLTGLACLVVHFNLLHLVGQH